ncbi:ABC transporter substrate-binding protein [Pedobacter sp. L105]|uniref:ABC transporter substrate-binding protein n=1 Tax=Pedobacter sp. L105 TaxID=1641871 RepID=UPI00131D7349|nr:ABC transporter substrate-binding protein [Pedobacter sp. L105]
MILVQNRQLQLSGNKFLYLILGCFCLAACSPKVKTTPSAKNATVKKEEKPAEDNRKLTEADISLLIPFDLKSARIKTGSKADLERSAMAIDFYQGFKMGVDSAAALGLSFKVKVLDTRDNDAQIATLLKEGQLTGSNLIVGPVFPEGMKAVTAFSIANTIPVVSPLAATHPSEFNNPNLISVVNNIDLHAQKMGDYITNAYNEEKTVVVLINTRKSGDELMGAPIRKYFQKGNGSRFIFQEYSSVFTMETHLIPGKQYVVLVSSSDKPFVIATLDKLVKMKNSGITIDLFGHPNWGKQDYNTDKLQLLNTKVTSSYRVDYKSQAVTAFIRKYRHDFDFEPSEYSFKGFDEGFYFGTMLAKYGRGYLKHLTEEKYKGLQNSFSFVKDDQLGYINTELFLLEYKNYTLNPVQ